MVDIGHKQTDEALERLEKRLAEEYAQAYKEVEKKAAEYFAKFEKSDKEKKKLVDAGEIKEKEYQKWRSEQMLKGKRWNDLRDTLAKDLTNTNQIAAGIVRGELNEVFAINANYSEYLIENAMQTNYGFTLYDRDTIATLVKDDPDIIPWKPEIDVPADLRWNRQMITSHITQGILQGESIPNLSKRLLKTVNNDKVAAVRTARTAVTSSENAGRQMVYDRAKKMGLKLQKEWMATLDKRTRHEHGAVDGQRVPLDGKFNVGGYKMEYPGDMSAPPYLVYNCRCTMVTVEPDYITKGEEPRITYKDWVKNSIDRSGGVSTETYMLPVNAQKDEIERMKSELDYESAEKLVGAQRGFCYRAYHKDDGMSSWGHAMFADATDMLDQYGLLGGEKSRKWFSVSETQLTDINDLKEDIIEARQKYWETVDPDFFADISDDEFFSQFAPDDIVMSAAAYDDDRTVGWLYEYVLEPKEIPGVKTPDGAVVYDPTIMVRNLPMEVYAEGKESAEDVVEAVQEAVEKKESADMLEYLNYKNMLINKYGLDNMWADMTDSEMETIDRLERIAYKGK